MMALVCLWQQLSDYQAGTTPGSAKPLALTVENLDKLALHANIGNITIQVPPKRIKAGITTAQLAPQVVTVTAPNPQPVTVTPPTPVTFTAPPTPPKATPEPPKPATSKEDAAAKAKKELRKQMKAIVAAAS